MGLPNINITFSETANTTIERGSRGIVALVLKDSIHNGLNTYYTISDMPTDYSSYNQDQITKAFIGGVNPPSEIIVYVEPTTATDYTSAMGVLETTKWDYLAVPGIDSTDANTIATWVKGLRDTNNIKVKAVLPNNSANHEGIINFATDNIIVGSTTYHTADYCARIAGLLAGTPLTQSATYEVLSEVTDVPHLSVSAFNSAINSGELLLMNDGTNVKVARAVNSLTTVTSSKGADYQKIKMVDIMDQMYTDITSTIANNYIGKFPNDYDHKVLLISALTAYNTSLENQDLLDLGKSSVGIDIAAQSTYLQSNGVDIIKMSIQQIKEANTGDNVFIAESIKILDAMEDFNLAIAI